MTVGRASQCVESLRLFLTGASQFLNFLSSNIIFFELVDSSWPYYLHSIAAIVR